MSAATLRPVARASCLNWRNVVSGSLTVIPFIIIHQGNSILTEWQYHGYHPRTIPQGFDLSRRCDQFSEKVLNIVLRVRHFKLVGLDPTYRFVNSGPVPRASHQKRVDCNFQNVMLICIT